MTPATGPILNLSEIAASTVSGTDKGIPTSAAPVAVSDVAARGWSILREDVSFPAAVLRDAGLLDAIS